jgi:HEAT repeat protein
MEFLEKERAGKLSDHEEHLFAYISQLGNPDPGIRMEIRRKILNLGKPVIPYLIANLYNRNDLIRCEAAQILSVIDGSKTPKTLVLALDNPDLKRRWDATQDLIEYDRAAVIALLRALSSSYASVWLRQGAQHVLKILKKRGSLTPEEEKVVDAFTDIEPSVSVPSAAVKALTALEEKSCIDLKFLRQF